MQIYKAKYWMKSYVEGSGKRKKRKKGEYFIINATRALSYGDFSSDITRGCLKGKNVNDIWIKMGWYEKFWFDKREGQKNK